jgi:hypothetical protein
MEAFMKVFDSRSFVAGIAASSLRCLEYHLDACAPICDSQITDDRDLPHGCIFARMERQKSISTKRIEKPVHRFLDFQDE